MSIWTAFILGLVGSLHCAGMCGPLALALPAAGGTMPAYVLGRVAYNLGRMITYCLFGLIFGFIGKTMLMVGMQRWVSIGLGVVIMLGLFASRRLALWRPVTLLVEQLKSRMSGLLRQRTFAALACLGLLNGLLPCGLVYVACAGATASEGAMGGMQYMVAFGAGTVPMMFTISVFGKLIPMSLRLQMRKAIPVCVFLLASLLILRGMSLDIPYLSPDLSKRAGSCCTK